MLAGGRAVCSLTGCGLDSFSGGVGMRGGGAGGRVAWGGDLGCGGGGVDDVGVLEPGGCFGRERLVLPLGVGGGG